MKTEFFQILLIFIKLKLYYNVNSVLSANIEKYDFDENLNYGAKIFSKNGNLIIESAKNRNITFQLNDNSCLLINDINALEILKTATNLIGDSSFLPELSSLSSSSVLSINAERHLTQEITNLQRDVENLDARIRRLSNRTNAFTSTRLRIRVRLLESRVTVLERKINENECNNVPCKNGGTCVDLYDDFHCYCPSNWEGKTCEDDVDECYEHAGTDLGCQNNARCINTPGSYRCECSSGWVGLTCKSRNVDCTKSSSTELCGHGVCVNVANNFGYTCICDQGWMSTNITPACTVDVDECVGGKHHCVSTCINLPGSYACGPCPSGYSGDGMSCIDIDECALNNGGCSLSPKVNCINTEGSYRCGSCPPGWAGDGRNCYRTETANCDSNSVCHPSATCQYISGTTVCICPQGMTGHGFGQYGCAPVGNPCQTNPCKNGGTCVSTGTSFTCTCPLGFMPPNCDLHSSCNPNPCQNGGTCIPMAYGVSYTCACPPNYSGPTCSLVIDACGSVIRQRSGTLKYPVSGNYEPNRRCGWVFRTEENKVLNIIFTKFDLKEKDPSAEECNKDWLQIHDGRSSAAVKIGRFCGTQLPKDGNFTSSHNQLYLWFRSNNSPGRGGFELSWNTTDPVCGGFIEVESHGVIKSPGWPGKSSPNRDCEWKIQAPLSKRIHLTFFDVTLVGRSTCNGDYLSIIDGSYSEGDVIEKFCESGTPQPIYSSSESVTIHFHTDNNGYDSSFQMHYSVVEGNPSCGGYYTDRYGTFTSPTISTTLMRKLMCHYLIHVPEGTRIQLEFLTIESSSLLCSVSFIEVYDGKTDEDPLIKRFCNDDTGPGIIISSTNYLLVKHQSNSLTAPALNVKFTAEYKTTCDFTFTDLQGVIQSPRYPASYLPSIECTYKIELPPEYTIALHKMDFNLTNKFWDTTNSNCTHDYVTIYYPLLKDEHNRGEFCKDFPTIYVVNSNHMYLVFKTDRSTVDTKGFQLSYESMKLGCGGIYKQKRANLTYANSVYDFCEWIIIASDGDSVYLEFNEFELPTEFCNTDNLKIFTNNTDKNELVGTYCGKNKPPSVFYTDSVITLQLKRSLLSFGDRTNYGFNAKYEIIDARSPCGGNYTSPSGVIKSPRWPNKYLSDIDCIWIIHAPIGIQIELDVESFELEGLACRYDFLEIRNGVNENAPLIGRYCDENIPKRIPSYTNHLWIRFQTDSSDNYQGFKMTWKQASVGCGGTLTSYIGAIQSPHYPDILSDVAQCEWVIRLSAGSKIQLNVTVLQLTGQLSDSCEIPFLFIYDGSNTLSPKLKLNCNHLINNEMILLSSSNTVIVRFVTMGSETGSNGAGGFFLSYKINCNQDLYDFSGIIESPNFPNNYPDLINCNWKIYAKHNNKISLAFSHLDLEDMEYECIYDQLKIYDIKSNETLKTYDICTFPNDIIMTTGNTARIQFTTDLSNSATGFRIEYQIQGCGGILRKNFGGFETPNNPYSVKVYCEWTVEAPIGRVVSLSIVDLQFENINKDCNANGLLISNDKEHKNVVLKICETQNINHRVTSNNHKLYIRFYTNDVRERKYVKAVYNFENAKCGGDIRGISGNIYSPNYPNLYPSNSICEWRISAESYHHLELSFVDLKLENSTNCQNDYVKISQYTDDMNEIESKRYCGNNLPTPNLIRSKERRMLVSFQSDNKTESSGFNLRYQRNCGKDIIVEFSSGYISKGFSDKDCLWTIKTNQPGAHVTVRFYDVQCQCEGSSPTTCEQTKGITVFEGDSLTSTPKITFCNHNPPEITSTGNSLLILGRTGYFEASYTIYENSCGANLKSIRGKFTSPRYPNSYPVNVDCIWNIKTTPGNKIKLNVIKMDISQSDNCNEDYLEIRENNESGKPLAVLCNSLEQYTAEQLTVTAYENMWIKFHSDDDGVAAGFMLSWEYVHNNEINGTKGSIRPPPLESIRDDDINYSWRILVSRGYVIQLMLKEYSDGLKIYDGYDETAPEMEIQYSPSEQLSHTNAIYIQANNKILRQFLIEWLAVSKSDVAGNLTIGSCPTQIMVLSNFSYVNISSPGYPYGYDAELDCEWIVKTNDRSTHALFIFIDVDLENVTDCSADFIEISTSDNLIDWKPEKKACSIPRTYGASDPIHGRPYLKVHFHTDVSDNRTGFSAYIVPACGGVMTDPHGTINGHTGSTIMHAKVMNCTWSIRVKPGRKIQFEFIEMKIPPTSTGTCDSYVSIRDGIDEHSPHLGQGRFCMGVDTSKLPLTTSHRAFIIFSFSLFDHLQWELAYKEVSEDCGDTIWLDKHNHTTIIATPNYPNIPNPHTECDWTIIGPPGETLQLEFVDLFDLTPYADCPDEYVEIKDGSTNLSPLIGRFCRKPNLIVSTDNSLYVKFVTDISDPRNGFKALIKTSKCGGAFYNTRDDITSLHYPAIGAYPSNSVCNYTIKSTRFSRISIVFEDIDLPPPPSSLSQSSSSSLQDLNKSDHLVIYSIQKNDDDEKEEQEIMKIFGNNTIPRIDLESNEILIRFFTYKQNFKYRGFKIRYFRQFGLCGGLITNDEGNITFTKNIFRSSSYRYPITCRWRIQAPKGRRVTAKILSIERMTDIKTYTINFYNDFYGISEIMNSSSDNPNVFKSSDNVMLILFKNYPNTTFLSAKISYNTFSLSPCMSSVNDNGIITSLELSTSLSYYCSIKSLVNNNETIGYHLENLISQQKHNWRYRPLKFTTITGRRFKDLYGNLTNVHIAMSINGSIEMLQTLSSDPMLNFKISYKRNPCGGTYSFFEYFNITLPNNLSDSYGIIDCAWEIKRFTYIPFNLSGIFHLSNNDCNKEFITIHNGISPMDPIIRRICHNTDNIIINFSINRGYTYIHYHSDQYDKNSNIQIYAKPLTNCGGILTTTTGSLSGRLYRQRNIQFTVNDYKNNQECIWEYNGKQGYSTEIEFYGRFFIEDSNGCNKDYLDIQHFVNNEWITMLHTCGRIIPNKLNTTSTRLRVIFRSDDENIGDGFNIKFNTYCGGIYNVTDYPQILAREFSYYYSNNLICNYTLISNTNDTIMIKFKEFVLDSSATCTFGSMEIFKQSNTAAYYSYAYGSDGSNNDLVSVGKYCTENSIKSIRGKKRIVLYLNGLSVRNYGKFKIEYYHDKCGGNVTQSREIQLINNNNDNNNDNEEFNCIWYITAPKNMHILIKVKYLNIKQNYLCHTNYLAVYETNEIINNSSKNSTIKKLKARLCGNLTNEKILLKLNTNTGTLIRNSNQEYDYEPNTNNKNDDGFIINIDFIENCDQYIYLDETNSTYRLTKFFGSYENKLDCHYIFKSPLNYNLKIEFHQFNVTPCHNDDRILNNNSDIGNCECDFVEIRDGDTSFSELINRYCGTQLPTSYLSTLHKLFVRFTTDDALTATGFDATIHLTKSDCGKQDYNLSDKPTIIEFPTSHENYPPNVFCKWILKSNVQVSLNFVKFDLESQSETSGKCLDYLEIIHEEQYGYQQKNKYCGNKIPQKMDFENSVELRFKSNAEIQGKGFKLIAQNANLCSQNFTSPNGQIQLQAADEECITFIKVPENNTLAFHSYPLYMYKDCSDEYIEFFDEIALKPITKLCNRRGELLNIFTNTSYVKIKAKTPLRIDITYMSSQNSTGCGGKLIGLHGVLTSPLYPESVRKNMQCRWDIHTSVDKVIALHFDEFDMGSKMNCATDYLQIAENSSNGKEKIINTFCGPDNPGYLKAKSNNLAIIYNKTVNFDGVGWVIRVSSVDNIENIYNVENS